VAQWPGAQFAVSVAITALISMDEWGTMVARGDPMA